MSTISTDFDVYETDQRSRRLIFSLRSSISNIDEFNESKFEVKAGETKVFKCSKFIYLHLRDPLTLSVALYNTAAPLLVFNNYSGPFCFTQSCQISLAAPALPTTFLSKGNVIYS